MDNKAPIRDRRNGAKVTTRPWVANAADIILVLIFIMTLIMLLVTFFGEDPSFPVITYSDVERESQTLCPDQIINYGFQGEVTQAPSVVMIARTVWSRQTQVTESRPNFEGPFVWLDQGLPLSRLGGPFRIPDVPPGEYELRVAVVAITERGLSTPSAFSVPFEVPEDCSNVVPAGDTIPNEP